MYNYVMLIGTIISFNETQVVLGLTTPFKNSKGFFDTYFLTGYLSEPFMFEFLSHIGTAQRVSLKGMLVPGDNGQSKFVVERIISMKESE